VAFRLRRQSAAPGCGNDRRCQPRNTTWLPEAGLLSVASVRYIEATGGSPALLHAVTRNVSEVAAAQRALGQPTRRHAVGEGEIVEALVVQAQYH
jgi:hypothetical protein